MFEAHQMHCLESGEIASLLSKTLYERLFPRRLELVPQLNEVYELELAYYESQLLSDEEILRNGAYFARVDGHLTRHFLMCQGQPLKLARHSSSRLKSFFESNQFKTGYATHGLFPYRGKFHPQMIKGLINVMGIKPGDTVLDPMMGSGTVPLEATLMGINSIGIDTSPFCVFMAKAKIEGLIVPLTDIKVALQEFDSTFKYLAQEASVGESYIGNEQVSLFKSESPPSRRASERYEIFENQSVKNYLMLAFLDAKGYAERSKRKSFREQFKAILERYCFVAEKIQKVLKGMEAELGEAVVSTGDARKLNIETNSIDGIIFSPPYSFAIDYLKNDYPHLKVMGVNVNELRDLMIGLRGKDQKKRYDEYVKDMREVLFECSRVLKPGKLCTIIVGTNRNQLSKILKVKPEEVPGIDEILVNMAKEEGFRLVRKIERQITGMANTMRSEFIVILQKG
ncbi:MAG: hypothetical protein DRH12_10550 [Deltaproteobacteria bacterium]|nr:MAG: hypothetical protein DRH12_10550 [Deltaproteobacteria bacterium]